MHLQKNIPEITPTVSGLPSQLEMWKKFVSSEQYFI